ncbi:DUF559 domain-containing protein [Rhodococcus sp. HNM0569]|uniref:DUF559 domain-containing protein n=1 Tax=Rhodococcus sp. HNM0569 TaxID=2716340 RepID=UPI00146A324E|nr:DUF559 domain-containing protein [Rhodococcus sp. HNM0569]NLU82761.1 DUF559 domain-containing protein [Rhodococcus sp. HNM0569]
MHSLAMPFHGPRAVAAGVVTRHQLALDHVRVYPGIHVDRRTTVDALVRAHAAALFTSPHGVLTGLSAAAVHGASWIPASAPAEVVRNGHYRPTPGLLTYNRRLEPDEITCVDGVRVATPARAAFDLGCRLPRRRAVAVLDDLCAATALSVDAISELARRHRGARGVRQLAKTLAVVDAGAQSPPESHLRVLLIDSGLPRPCTQIPISDASGRPFAWADLGWPELRLVVEYDGEHHWTDRAQRAWDIERHARIEALGWTVVRVSAELLYDRPADLVRRVARALENAERAVSQVSVE